MDENKVTDRPVQTERSEPKVIVREKNRMSNIFTRVLMSFLLVAAGVALVWLLLQQRDTDKLLQAKNAEIAQLSTDKSSLQQQVGALRSGSAEKVAEATEQSIKDDILASAKAYVLSEESVKNDTGYAYNIARQTDEFARVSVGVPEGSGYYIVLKKTNGLWTVVASGQDRVPQAVADKYGIPADFQ